MTVHVSASGEELAPLVAGLLSSADSSRSSPRVSPQDGRRRLVGICGAPGAGKSTLASYLSGRLGAEAAHVPMDGFHLADVELSRQGLLDRKGAPETFDAWGYAALLERLRADPGHVVYAPGFDRTLEQPVAGAIAVEAAVRVVVTEGNYLLLDRPEWRAVHACLDEVWHVRVDERVRRRRLVDRHVAFGKDPDTATSWVERVDEPNARLVEASSGRADRVLDLTAWRGGSG